MAKRKQAAPSAAATKIARVVITLTDTSEGGVDVQCDWDPNLPRGALAGLNSDQMTAAQALGLSAMAHLMNSAQVTAATVTGGGAAVTAGRR